MPTRTLEQTAASTPTPAGTASSQVGFRQLFIYTLWFSLIAGLLETGILAVQRYALDRVIYRSSHYLWMPSAGALLVFSALMLLTWGVARLWPRAGRESNIVFILVALTAFSTLMVPRWIHPLAAIVLAVGVAVAFSRSAASATSRFASTVRRSTGVLLVLVVLLTGFSFVVPRLRERNEIANLGAAPRTAPNIVFLILDTVRAKSLSLFGAARATTPNIAALAQRGVVFERAIAPAPWTLPTHASFFTGRAPQELSADRFTPLNDAYPTLAETLAQRGYITAGFVANLAYASSEFGLGRGFQRWNDYPVSLSQVLTNSSLGRALLLEGYSGGRNSWLMRTLGVEHWIGHTRNAADINGSMLDWLSGRREDRPFFIFANYFDAHLPYLPPENFRGRFGPIFKRSFATRLREERPGKWLERGDASAEQALLDRYEESIAYLDAAVGELVRELETRGLLDNTILVIGSDHGEEFGEHGFYEHDTSVYFTQTQVPLVVLGAGIPQGVRVSQPVGLADLPSTLLELSTGEAGALPGQSLAGLWSGQPTTRRPPVVAVLDQGRRSQASIVTPQYHFIRFKTGEERLYDHVSDPAERNDLSRTAAGTAVIAGLRAQLKAQAGEKIFQPPRQPK